MKTFYKKCSQLVILYGIFTAVSLAVHSLPAILIFFDVDILYFNLEFTLPIDVIITFWTSISAAYVAVDRGVRIITSSKEPKGVSDYGDTTSTLVIIVISFILFVVGTALEFFFAVNVQLATLATSFGSAVLLYITGQKAIYAAGKFGKDETTTTSDTTTATPVAKISTVTPVAMTSSVTPIANIPIESAVVTDALVRRASLDGNITDKPSV